MNNPVSSSTRRCPNCGTRLIGHFCSNCGQEDHSLAVPLYRLILDFLSDNFQFDSRVGRTLLLLLFKPGQLTRDYLAGQRQSHIPPIRLYLFATIIFFLVIGFSVNFNSPNLLTINSGPAAQVKAPASGTRVAGVTATIGKALSVNLVPYSATKLDHYIKQRIAESARKKAPASASKAPTALKAWLKSHNEAIRAHPQEFVRQLWANTPRVLFFLLPVFALLLKVFYLLRKRYYSEHLIFTLHYHSVLFINFLIIALLVFAKNASPGPLAVALDWVIAGIGVWSGIYLFPAMRVVYADSWPGVIWRGTLILSLYSITLLWAAVGAVMVTFAMS